jgi:ADP-heptose:LPS heptosyltransferase
MMRRLVERLRGNELDRLLAAAAKRGARRVLLYWNRGLGDIALGLYALIARIRAALPGAEITVLTRTELAEPFRLMDVDRILVAPALERGAEDGFAAACRGIGIRPESFDLVMDRPDPTKWLAWQIGTVTPKLRWQDAFDSLWRRFDALAGDAPLVGAHVSSETGRFYGYVKDWPAESWRALFARIGEEQRAKVVLFGLSSHVRYDSPGTIDLRGGTTFLEMLSVIRNRCSVLVAPDGGVLTMAYYLDVDHPLTMVSLWADPRQGVLKQRVASPNPRLRHVPLIGAGEDVSRIPVDDVYRAVAAGLSGSRAS